MLTRREILDRQSKRNKLQGGVVQKLRLQHSMQGLHEMAAMSVLCAGFVGIVGVGSA